MIKSLMSGSIVLGILSVYLHADAKQDQKAGYQAATIASVAKYEAPSPYLGSPTDAPLPANDYAYNVGICFNCMLFTGRYESAFNYLPAVFAASTPVDVRMKKHVLYVNVPASNREVKMGIVGRSRLKDGFCAANK